MKITKTSVNRIQRQVIRDYHGLAFSVGVEVEAVGTTQDEGEEIIWKSPSRLAGFDSKFDTSLKCDECKREGRHGCDHSMEMTTRVMQTTTDLLALKWAVEDIVRYGGGYVNDTCGLHVHIGMPPEFATFNFRMKLLRNYVKYGFVDAAKRLNGNTAACSYNENDWLNQLIHEDSRYYAINFLSLKAHGTVEFRQHKGTLNYKEIYLWIIRLMWLMKTTLDDKTCYCCGKAGCKPRLCCCYKVVCNNNGNGHLKWCEDCKRHICEEDYGLHKTCRAMCARCEKDVCVFSEHTHCLQ